MSNTGHYLLLGLCLLMPLPLHAQDEVISLDSIVVAAEMPHLTATVTRITGPAMQQQNVAVAYDALRYEPGLHVVQRLALTGAGLTRLTIRGLGGDGPAGLAVFIDGRPDPTVSFAHPAPQAHAIGDVEIVEVFHGPSPVLHGSGNTGVVNIRSREPVDGWSGRVAASGGSAATTENFATSSYGWKGGFVSASTTYRRTDGYIADADAWVAGGKVRAGVRLNDDWKLSLSAGQSRDHFAVFGPFSVPGPFGNPGTTDLDLTQTVADVKLEGEMSGISTSVQLWGDLQEPRSQIPPEGAEIADVYEAGSRIRASASPWKSGRMIAGLDVLWAAARNTPALPPAASEVDVSISEVGPFLFVEQRMSPYVAVNGGIRFTMHSAYGSEPSGEAGVLVRPGGDEAGSMLHGTSMRARVSRGFQSPTLQQLYGVFRGTVTGPPNPDLAPEQVTQVEGSVLQRFSLGEVRLVAFAQEGSNQIVPVAGELQNAGDFSHSGLEAGLQLRPTRRLLLDVGLTQYNLSEGVLRVPHHAIDFMVMFVPRLLQDRDLTLTLYGRHAAKTYDQALAPGSPLVRLDDYFVANAKLRFRAFKSIYAFVELDNLTDEAYQTVLSIPMPGRSAFVGASVHW